MSARTTRWAATFGILLSLLLFTWRPARGDEAAWSLDQSIDYALAHNPDLAEAQAAIQVAQEAQDAALSGFMPQLNLSGGYMYIGNVPTFDINVSPSLPPPMPAITINQSIKQGANDNWKASIDLSQTLFASGRIYYSHEALGEQTAAKRHEWEAGRVRVAQATAEAFYGVLMAREALEAQTQALASSRAHLTQVTHRFEAGASSKFELLRAQVEVANLEPQVEQVAKQLELAKTGFRRAAGLREDAPVVLAGKLETEIQPVDRKAAGEAAARNRPELAALRSGESAYENVARARRGEMLPAFGLTGSYSYQKPYYMNLDGDYNWTVGVGVQIPIFDGLRAYRNMSGAQASAEGLRRTRDRMMADINSQLDTAALSMREAAQRIDDTKSNVARAEDMARMAADSYAAGALTSLDVIDAQLAATRARLAYLLALYDYRIAQVRLASAAGDLQGIER
jgi:outer membrane protein TolC